MRVTDKGEAYVEGYQEALEDISNHGQYTPEVMEGWAHAAVDILELSPDKGLVPFLLHIADTLRGD